MQGHFMYTYLAALYFYSSIALIIGCSIPESHLNVKSQNIHIVFATQTFLSIFPWAAILGEANWSFGQGTSSCNYTAIKVQDAPRIFRRSHHHCNASLPFFIFSISLFSNTRQFFSFVYIAYSLLSPRAFQSTLKVSWRGGSLSVHVCRAAITAPFFVCAVSCSPSVAEIEPLLFK